MGLDVCMRNSRAVWTSWSVRTSAPNFIRLAGIVGLPGPTKVKRLKGIVTADDLVHRKFHRISPNELWVTDITENPTSE
jgi:hypothetical protein